jgi:2-desacetyl-2-hydroxyethyl bacteriochlorophyllide A dehydrogenase
MKAICVTEPNRLEIQERPMPVLTAPDHVLVKVVAAGICGSDMHIYHGSSPVATYPRVLGHEIAGEIMATGTAVASFAKGDRVVMDPVIHCGACYQCTHNRQNVCRHLQVRSVHVDGGYQEYIVLPEKSIYRIPPQLSWEEAVMIEPFTIAEQVCARAELAADDIVFIMGAGPVGLSILKRVKLSGAKCFISDIVDSRLALAESYGADEVIHAGKTDAVHTVKDLTGGDGATVVIDAVCSVNSFEQSLQAVCAAGRVIPLGFNPKPSAITQLSITAREIDIRGSRLHNNRFPEVIAHFAEGRIQVSDMITHRFHFMAVREAFQLMEDANAEKGKVILQF